MNDVVFDRVYILGFLSIGEAEVDLRDQGFVLVKGENRESSIVQSNGSGKSTIFDSIFWTLCGETLRGATDVVNEKMTDTGCLCKLDFHVDSRAYTITRTKSHKNYGNSCYFYIDGELVSDQTKKSQEMISKTIPAVSSPEILGSIILLGQGLPYKFSSFSPTKRKDLLETMSGSDSEISKVKYKLDIEESGHSKKVSDLNSDTTRCEGLISGHQNTISILKQQIDSVKSKEEAQEEIEKLQSDIIELRNSIDSKKEAIEKETKQLQDYTTARDGATNLLNQYRISVATIKEKLSSIKSGNCPTCGRPYEVTEEVISQKNVLDSKMSQFVNQIPVISSKVDDLNSRIQQSNTSISTMNRDISASGFRISDYEKSISQLNNQIDQTNDLEDKITDLDKQISELKVKIHDNKTASDIEQEFVDCIGYLKRQLSRDFKGYMLKEVIKFMSTRSEYYSQYLFSNGKKIEVSLSGNKILISVGGRLYENLSGGERQRVDLAVQFSLRDMLVMTSGFSCNLLVLDEAFDNLDAQGSDALIKLVVAEFSDIDSVFTITHHSEIDIPYDKQVIVIKGSDGISQIQG